MMLDAIAIRTIFEFLPIAYHQQIAFYLGHTKHSLHIVRVYGIHLSGCQRSISVIMSSRGIEAAAIYYGSVSRAIDLIPHGIWVDDWLNYVESINYATISMHVCYASSSQIERYLSQKSAWGDFMRRRLNHAHLRQD